MRTGKLTQNLASAYQPLVQPNAAAITAAIDDSLQSDGSLAEALDTSVLWALNKLAVDPLSATVIATQSGFGRWRAKTIGVGVTSVGATAPVTSTGGTTPNIGITVSPGAATTVVGTTRTLSTTAPITGGGDLSADRTLAISAASGVAAGSMSAADFTKLAGITPGASAVVFDNTVAQVNIRSNRLTNQQPIDNTFVGITCFGSLTAGVNTIKGDYSTIGGGNRNGIGTGGASTHGTVAGGLVNTIGSASNHCTISGGFNNAINDASGDDSTISGGISNIISKPTATIGGGTGNVVGGTSATVSGGNACTANGDFSHVPGGLSNQATGNAACALNRGSLASGNQSFAHGMGGSATRGGQYSHGGLNSGGLPRYGRVIYTGSLAAGVSLTTELLYGPDADKFAPQDNKAYALFIEMVVAQNGIGVGVPASAVLTLFTTMASDVLSANVNVSALVAVAAAVGDATLATCTLTASIVAGKLKLLLTGPVAGPALIVAATMRFTEITHT